MPTPGLTKESASGALRRMRRGNPGDGAGRCAEPSLGGAALLGFRLATGLIAAGGVRCAAGVTDGWELLVDLWRWLAYVIYYLLLCGRIVKNICQVYILGCEICLYENASLQF